MKRVISSIGFTLFCGFLAAQAGLVQERYRDEADYMKARRRLIEAERALRLDAGIELTPEEEEANRRLMVLKKEEIKRTREHFPPAHNFLESKTRALIDSSPLLEILERMPKGGILHAHGVAMGDLRWLVSHATYLPNCYIYQGGEMRPPRGTLQLFEEPPQDGWRLVNRLRKMADDVRAFDEEIYLSVTLGEEDLVQPDIWEEFSNCFRRAFRLLSHSTVYEGFCRKMLRDLVDENVQYVESRGSLGGDEIIKEIQRDYPDFDVKFISAGMRSNTREEMAENLNQALELRQSNPSRFIGFDMVEEEDRNHTNLFFIRELLDARSEARRRRTTLPFYLHSGESNWVDNENVVDAVLLGAKRIGHGLTLIKHPLLMQIVKERDIAIEVCPISNQVLGYVPDLRNHPAVHYINAGLPVVLCPDDPGIMRYTFSYDYYVAFMAWGLDLRSLKQLAINSLLYSAMEPEEKESALLSWRKKWADFVTWLNERG